MGLNMCMNRPNNPGVQHNPGRENFVNIHGKVIIERTFGRSPPGSATSLRLYSGTHVDRGTGKGKLSGEACLKHRKNSKLGKISVVTYNVTFNVEPDFGTPGAIVVKNGNRQEFLLKYVQLEMSVDRSLLFECNSWVYPYKKTNYDRLFFINTIYLPSKTPLALKELRQEELKNLVGNGRGERKDWERIYDYDYYNDLGNPDKGQDRVRPVLGGVKTHPYPRRCRTGRPVSKTDGITEIRKSFLNLDYYVPPDDRFSPSKLFEFLTNGVQAIMQFVTPEVKSLFEGDINNFKSFDQLKRDFYSKPNQASAFERVIVEKLKSLVPAQTYKEVMRMLKENPVKFPIPQVIEYDDNAWRSDEEFTREMVAGLNPTVIKILQQFPPFGVGGRSSITASHIEGNLEGKTIETAMNQKLIYILDHHDYLMPYLRRINEQGVCIYASRTLLFLRHDGTLKPLAIELSLPGDDTGESVDRVFLPARQGQGVDAALWNLAKAHVAVNDSGYHQLISHWLFTHAAVEPFVIATRRQLSVMHPVYKLLDPHFKDTMQINALARGILLNAGGILERTMFPGKYAMELSSSIYASWRFTEQALPHDLLKRGVAFEDPSEPTGVSLCINDYPYAVDGLEIWAAIKTWVTNFCTHFYRTDHAVVEDAELQAWWDEIRHVGHGDRHDDGGCWLPLDSLANLIHSITTLIWIASALHAAVNFGQYGYAGFPPNRPTRCRKFIPSEGTPEFAEFARIPEKYFFEMIPDRFTITLGIALIEVLSTHTSDEMYLGQRASSRWTDDGTVLHMFDEFREELRRVEKRIEERNKDLRLKNRRGPVNVPYTLMYPDTCNYGVQKGITGKGIPNSVSV